MKLNLERQIVDTLLKICETTNIDEVTTTLIINEAGIKRSTFYYYFDGIEDLVTTFYLVYPLKDFRLICDLKNLVQAIDHHLSAYATFNQMIANSAYRDCLFFALYNWSFLFFKAQVNDQLARILAYGLAGSFLHIFSSCNKNYQNLVNELNSLINK